MGLAVSTAPRRRAPARFWALALLGSAVLAAGAQVALPARPVPATLQGLAVPLLGALGDARLGAAAVAPYLPGGALGLPVFAGGNAGPAALAGPTGGFLLGFPPAAWLAGRAGEGPLWRRGAVLLAARLLLFVPGVAWLAGFVGAERAFAAGFAAFLPATPVKTALALAVVRAVRR